MYVDISEWLMEGINLDDLESGGITPLNTTDDPGYTVYNDYYYNYTVTYSQYLDYYNYYNYYNYYDYYNYSNSIAVNLHPISQSVLINETVTLTVGATNTIDSCQWYIADSATGAGTAISGATSPTYRFVASSALDGKYYYCIVRRGGNSATSSRALITVRSLTVYDIYVLVGDNLQIVPVFSAVPSTTTIVSASVANTAVATVTNTGLITGKSLGSTRCTVTGSNGVTAEFTITVVNDPLVVVFMNTAIAIRHYRNLSHSIYPNQMANTIKGSSSSSSYGTLEELFTDIANAIRSIDRTTSPISPHDFYQRILAFL